MVMSAPVKAAALLVFIAAIAGATYGVTEVVGSTVESQLLTATTPHKTLNATGGHTVTYVLSVHNRDTVAREVVVEVDGIASGKSATRTILGNATEGIFVSVEVPADAPVGDHPLTVRVTGDGRVFRESTTLLALRVLAPAPGFQQGDSGEATYVGRLTATGRVFNMNDADLVGVAIPKTDSYRFSPGALPIQTAPRPNVVQGLYEGMLGMQPGESRTITFGFEKGYGPATQEEVHARDETIPRELTVPNDAQRVPRATFDSYIQESKQGDPAAFAEGDIFTLRQNHNDWPYRVTNITSQVVEYKLAAQVGDHFTVYPFWANASEVLDINETHIVFHTTPTTEPGAKFTMKAYWPQMSAVKESNETHIVVRHSPPVGFSYSAVAQGGQPREGTIREVTEERVIVAYPSANPLAGKDLTFDLTLLTLEK